jgi:hypothetical protein
VFLKTVEHFFLFRPAELGRGGIRSAREEKNMFEARGASFLKKQ